MNTISIIRTALSFAQAIIILWIASQAILRERTIRPFFPLIVFVVAFCGFATVSYYQLVITMWQAIFSYIFLIGYFLLLAGIIGRIRKQP